MTLYDTMLTNPTIPYDLCVGVPISHGLKPTSNSVYIVLNVKVLVDAFD